MVKKIKMKQTQMSIEFTTNNAISIFIIIVAALGVFFGMWMLIAVHPRKYWIDKVHKYPMLDINKYYFYYQKATAYRMLFTIHTICTNTFKILGTTMTFITVYCAIDGNNYILLFSMISAISQTITILIPSDKYVKIYVEAARVLEYALNTKYDNENTQEEKLREAYKKAEEIIQKDFA